MREILFRGKIVRTGEWVCGGIVHQTDHYGEPVDRYYIIDGTETQDYDIGYEYEVDPKTVGQYTGLTDKNGKRIFEGDILSFETMRGTISFTVYYDEECGVWQPFGDSYCGFDPKDVEVIGNIHDNPELLEDKR